MLCFVPQIARVLLISLMRKLLVIAKNLFYVDHFRTSVPSDALTDEIPITAIFGADMFQAWEG